MAHSHAAFEAIGLQPHLEAAQFMQSDSAAPTPPADALVAAYELLLFVSEQSLLRLKRQPAASPSLRPAIAAVISHLEAMRRETPTLGDRAAAPPVLEACAQEQLRQARARAQPTACGGEAGSSENALLRLRLLHAAAEYASRALCLHDVMAQLPQAERASASREDAEATRADIEQEILKLEEHAAAAICKDAQAWLDEAVTSDERELESELRELNCRDEE
ncbi:hypothetical protein AB1Y20_015656 [Prymnesium parvum]|uniref:Uncharacterized protein n=1 Tax=Prymnesium parvum TaxID=97485 RepID=A0AB34K1K1_PRYPA